MLSLLATPVLAANKCVDPSGRISYQADPCPANSRGGDMSLNINRPFTGQAGIPPRIRTLLPWDKRFRRQPMGRTRKSNRRIPNGSRSCPPCRS